MAKKIFGIFAILIFSLCCSVCFANEDNNSNVNLGEEITDSINKAGDSVRNVADDVMNGIDGNRNNNNNNNNNTRINRNNNRDDNIYANGYNAVRTSVDEIATGNMSTTTWIWIILAVAAIIIVAMVWYYAVQNNNDD